MVGTGLARQRLLLVGGDGGDDPQAAELGELGENQPDTTGAGVHQHGVAFAWMCAAVEEVVRGEAAQHRRSGDVVGYVVGKPDGAFGRYSDKLCVAADRVHRRDPLTQAEAGHVRTGGNHGAGDLRSRNVRRHGGYMPRRR